MKSGLFTLVLISALFLLGCTQQTVPYQEQVSVPQSPRESTPLGADFSVQPSSGTSPLTVEFSDKSAGDISVWLWDFGDGQTSTSQNPQHIYSQTGIYTVRLRAISDAGCEKTLIKNQYIAARIVPDAAFIPKPELTLISVPTIQFNNTTKNETAGMEWFWNFDDPKITGGGKSKLRDPEYKYSDTGKYYVKMLAVNEYGCQDSVTRLVVVMPDVIAYIPTAFRPLGRNTLFKTVVDGIETFDIKIFSRWGELMYESTNYVTHGWNGTYLNSEQEAPLGVYVYVLKLKGLDGLDYKYSGTVTLLK